MTSKKRTAISLFTILVLTLFLLAACTSQQTTSLSENTKSMLQNSEQNNNILKEFFVEAFQFGYSPSELHVTEGDRVVIHLATRDVPHSLNFREFEINIPATAEKNGTGEFIANKKGRFTWNCRIPCGFGHSDMHGILVVE